jgi:predicted porin
MTPDVQINLLGDLRMKKLLIATAALAMVAGTVQAQSNVTIYGAYGNGLVSTKTNGAKAVDTMGGDRLGTPVLGFRGSEDLGGGMKAFFNLEGRLGANGSLGFTSPDAVVKGGSNIFDRQAHAGLVTSFGTLTLGRQADALKEIEGLAIFSNMTDSQNVTTVGDRAANLIKYKTPSIQGFTISYAYSDKYVSSSGSDNETGSGTQSSELNGTKHNSINAQYTFQGIKFAVAQAENAQTDGIETSSVRYSAQGKVIGATVGVAYTQNELNTAGTSTLDQLLVSVKAPLPVSKGVSLIASYANNDSTIATTNGKAYTLMLTKSLSKRTTVYAGYAESDVDTATSDTATKTFGLLHKF